MFRTLAATVLSLALAGPSFAAGQALATPAAQTEKAGAIVNLNTATASELEALPGIGPKMAQRIVEYREKNGVFKKVEDLMNVKGIGEKNFLKLKNNLTVAAKH